MVEQDLARFATLIVGIGEIYGKSFTSVVIEAYWNVLKGFEFAEVEQAFHLHLANPDVGKFLPKPADIIMAIEGSSQNQALLAWTKVVLAIGRIGSYLSVAFDDALIHAVIEDMEGWQKLCGVDDKQMPFIAKEFHHRYCGYVVKKPNRHPQYLIGRIESQNRINGYESASPVLIGNEAKAKQIMATGNRLSFCGDKRCLLQITNVDGIPRWKENLQELKQPNGNKETYSLLL